VDQSDNESHKPPSATSAGAQTSLATVDNTSQEEVERQRKELDWDTYGILTDANDGDAYYRSLFLPKTPEALSRLFSIHHSRKPTQSGGVSKKYRPRPFRQSREAQTGSLIRGGKNKEGSDAEEGPSLGQRSLAQGTHGGVIVKSEGPLQNEETEDEIAYMRDGLEGVFDNYGWK